MYFVPFFFQYSYFTSLLQQFLAICPSYTGCTACDQSYLALQIHTVMIQGPSSSKFPSLKCTHLVLHYHYHYIHCINKVLLKRTPLSESLCKLRVRQAKSVARVSCEPAETRTMTAEHRPHPNLHRCAPLPWSSRRQPLRRRALVCVSLHGVESLELNWFRAIRFKSNCCV